MAPPNQNVSTVKNRVRQSLFFIRKDGCSSLYIRIVIEKIRYSYVHTLRIHVRRRRILLIVSVFVPNQYVYLLTHKYSE